MTSNTSSLRKSQPLPEVGQLVEVRRRRWVVNDTSDNGLPGRTVVPQRLVSLTSIEDDALGEELQVVWQLEPGARVVEQEGLPGLSGYDADNKLEAFLDAVRWASVKSVSRLNLQAPFRSGITIEDYQLDPLARAVDMARVNLLIADDVGLGKTIEAGLVIQEMLLRHRARTVLIICPASLQLKWKTEMQEKFGLEFRIVDTDYLREIRRTKGIHVNPWTSFPRLITSMDWAKSGEGLNLIKEVLPPEGTYPRKFDILVVDEAHHVAPAGSSSYITENQRTRLVRRVAPHFQHRLFLTATPHNGYTASFTSLLELLDDQRFARTILPGEGQLRQVMVRRLKEDITDSQGKPVFPKRELRKLVVKYTVAEQKVHESLQTFIDERMSSVEGLHKIGAEFVHKLLKKRLFSSPAAFASTLEKYRLRLFGLTQEPRPSLMDENILRNAILRSEEEQSLDSEWEESEEAAIDAVSAVSQPLSQAERTLLDELSEWANKTRSLPDSKAEALLEWIDQHLRSDGDWNHRRVILFTEYRATLSWLQQILATRGLAGDHLAILHGSMPHEEREAVRASFQAHPDASPVRILIATDAAAEGIDLQNHCNYLIHVEIPWNPNLMEQRNGRIDRHGQKAERVVIWHPVGEINKGTFPHTKSFAADQEYLLRAALKVDSIRRDLGSVGSVLAKQIEDAMLGQGYKLDTISMTNRTDKARKHVVVERRFTERIQQLHQRILDTKKDANLSPDRVKRAVAVGLELAGKPALSPKTLEGMPPNSVFEIPHLTGSWNKATKGLEHPHTGERRPVTFDHNLAKGRDDVVLAHLNHPLVQMTLRLLREEIWKLDDNKHLNRVAGRIVSDALLSEPAIIVHSRLVITGGDHRRLHEEITLSGGLLREDRFKRIRNLTFLNTLLTQSRSGKPSPRLHVMLKERYERYQGEILSASQARSHERLRFLENTINQKMATEKEHILSILDELEAGIKRELGQHSEELQEFLPGLSPAETAQVKKDHMALEERLLRIPYERKQEVSTIERQYSDPEPLTLPVAVVIVIPESLMEIS